MIGIGCCQRYRECEEFCRRSHFSNEGFHWKNFQENSNSLQVYFSLYFVPQKTAFLLNKEFEQQLNCILLVKNKEKTVCIHIKVHLRHKQVIGIAGFVCHFLPSLLVL